MTAGKRRRGALAAASKTGDSEKIRELAPTGEELSARDEDGWSALDWAAGHGDPATVAALLAAGADPLAKAEDERTPYDIALAAGHCEAALLLRESAGGETRSPGWTPYCRAYPLSAVRAYPGWPEDAGERTEEFVYLHDDFTVTAAIWPGEDVVFAAVTPEWERFCRDELGFAAPDDLDLVPEADRG
ncbi:ankyrin repeat domain-containing protein [Amycolatopsis rubida]|uniref:Ankyrin repeat domain-containing protein n=1 Tax=Amycolatopsis rubida TaxID=112413 RepID=A0ABX0BJI5_9PSEU|nr:MULTISPECIES: ankyrin repeat domain-containing protein [Amycolatopsis]MYW90022.1 ankyrin repeat domain-containing protein [Amycolatopsis rubida]NEC54999.1 ankyrin repeat domain-containing protein [Amycolatopsis rubida]OAP20587.1 Ankyrin repeats (3 copies) [Amycolatopsis sp. M39]